MPLAASCPHVHDVTVLNVHSVKKKNLLIPARADSSSLPSTLLSLTAVTQILTKAISGKMLHVLNHSHTHTAPPFPPMRQSASSQGGPPSLPDNSFPLAPSRKTETVYEECKKGSKCLLLSVTPAVSELCLALITAPCHEKFKKKDI